MRGMCRLQDNIKMEHEEMWTVSTAVNWARTVTGCGFCDKGWRTYKLHKTQYKGLLENVRNYQLLEKGFISCRFCWTREWWLTNLRLDILMSVEITLCSGEWYGLSWCSASKIRPVDGGSTSWDTLLTFYHSTRRHKPQDWYTPSTTSS